LVRHNFCPGSKGYWTETNGDRVAAAGKLRGFRYLNEYAYPLNTIGKNEFMTELLNWSAAQGVIGLGRWGEHQHYNSDLTVRLAMSLAEKLV
ncbi:MAG: amine oxidoreductase, partial [Lentisphaeria bacterium]|nr:amine oxidoreductase [Lentisphaeria bacterium]